MAFFFEHKLILSFRTVEAAAAASESSPLIPEAWKGKLCFVVGEKTAAEVGRVYCIGYWLSF